MLKDHKSLALKILSAINTWEEVSMPRMTKENMLIFNEIKAFARARLASQQKLKKIRVPLNPEILKFRGTKENAVGDFWKNRRELAGLTQWELAAKLDYQNGQIISNVERGICGVPIEKLPEYCELLRVKKTEVRSLLLGEYIKKVDDWLKDIP